MVSTPITTLLLVCASCAFVSKSPLFSFFRKKPQEQPVSHVIPLNIPMPHFVDPVPDLARSLEAIFRSPNPKLVNGAFTCDEHGYYQKTQQPTSFYCTYHASENDRDFLTSQEIQDLHHQLVQLGIPTMLRIPIGLVKYHLWQSIPFSPNAEVWNNGWFLMMGDGCIHELDLTVEGVVDRCISFYFKRIEVYNGVLVQQWKEEQFINPGVDQVHPNQSNPHLTSPLRVSLSDLGEFVESSDGSSLGHSFTHLSSSHLPQAGHKDANK